MQISDQELIHECMLGSLSSFERLVKNYQQYAYRIAYGICNNPQDAEDMVQEAFVVVYRQIKSLRSAAAFPKWLATIVTNLSLKKVKKEATPPLPLEASALSANDSIDDYGRIDLKHDLHQALAQLPAEYRAAIVLRELQGYTYGEIAEILNIPLGTVKSRIHQARAILADLLQPATSKGENFHDL